MLAAASSSSFSSKGKSPRSTRATSSPPPMDAMNTNITGGTGISAPVYQDVLYDKENGTYKISYATPRRIVEAIISPQFPEDRTLASTVLATHRSFCDRNEFWALLRERYDARELQDEQDRLVVRARFYGVLKRWLVHVIDSNDFFLLHSISDFVRSRVEPISPITAAVLQQIINERKADYFGESESTLLTRIPTLKNINLLSPLIRAEDWFRSGQVLVAQPPLEIARQLTLREYQFFNAIDLAELHDRAWMANDKELRARNVVIATHSFNQVNNWVCQEIFGATPAARVGVIEFFIRVLTELRNIKNASSMLAILSALYANSVSRLKELWSRVDPHLRSLYEEQLLPFLDPMSNMRAIRVLQTKARLRNEPCVPYLGVYLSLIFLTDEGNPDQKLDGGVLLVNVRRCRLMAGLLEELRAFKQLPKYPFVPLDFINKKLDAIEAWPSSRFDEMSHAIQPRVSSRTAENQVATAAAAAATAVVVKPLHFDFTQKKAQQQQQQQQHERLQTGQRPSSVRNFFNRTKSAERVLFGPKSKSSTDNKGASTHSATTSGIS